MDNIKDNKLCLKSLKLLGDFWSLRIIYELNDNELRYCQIQSKVDSICTVTLTDRLKKLQAAGLVKRNESSRADVSYKLTESGKKVLPIINLINDFSKSLDYKTAE